MTKIKMLAVATVLLAPIGASAAPMSAQALITGCSSGADAVSEGTCLGYFNGLTEVLELLRSSNAGEQVDPGQVLEVQRQRSGECSGYTVAKAICEGYKIGAADAETLVGGRGRANSKLCAPVSVTSIQLRHAVLDFTKQQKLPAAQTAIGLVTAAMAATWPCSGGRRPP
jgi:hypothetical protein